MLRLITACSLALPCLLTALPAHADDDWHWSANGNTHLDMNRIDDQGDTNAASGIRRARLAVGVKAPSGFDAKAEYDVYFNTWTDVYLRWRPNSTHSVRLGQYKQPIYLDELTSDRYTMFMEQGLPSSFAIARRIGAEYVYAQGPWRATVSVFDGNSLGLEGGGGLGSRLVWAPINSGASVLHFAVAATTEGPESERARFNSRAEASNFSPRRFDTGAIADVSDIRRTGLEALWIEGPWSLQGEYLRADINRSHTSDLGFDGWYAQASWFPSGDHRGYKEGAVDGPDLGADHQALELALRVSHLDLDDGDIHGGSSTNWTAGATWYVNSNVRLVANYVHVDGDRRGTVVDPNVLEARIQLSY
jgi:phosphate-selective porin OprO and OprP